MATKKEITSEEKVIKLNSGKEITISLSSQSTELMDKMEKRFYNKDAKKREVELQDYLPISNIYLALDAFFPGYDIVEHEMEITDEKYETEYQGNKNVSVVCKKQVDLIYTVGSEPKQSSYIASGVCSLNILKSDDARYGFEAKLTARALKVMTKKLGRIFRVFTPSEDDTTTLADIVNAQETAKEEKTTPVAKPEKVNVENVLDTIKEEESKPIEETKPNVPNIKDIVVNEYSDFLSEKFKEVEMTKELILAHTQEFVKLKGYKQKTPEHNAVIEYYKAALELIGV